MKKIYTLFGAMTLLISTTNAQNVVDCSASDTWVGYMNVFDHPDDGEGYLFGSSWEVAALKTTADTEENTVTLQPNFNTYAENLDDPYWVNADTEEGNKMMEALTFVEPGDTYNENDLTFKGHVISNTLADGYEAKFFIKALNPDAGYSDALEGAKVVDLPASGYFTVSATAAELPAGLIIQYGFYIKGINGNPANEEELGSVVIGSSSLNIEESNELAAISVYPNPTSDLLFFTGNKKVEKFSIFNVTGKQVLTSGNANSIDVSALTPGIYFIRIEEGEAIKTIKFTKK